MAGAGAQKGAGPPADSAAPTERGIWPPDPKVPVRAEGKRSRRVHALASNPVGCGGIERANPATSRDLHRSPGLGGPPASPSSRGARCSSRPEARTGAAPRTPIPAGHSSAGTASSVPGAAPTRSRASRARAAAGPSPARPSAPIATTRSPTSTRASSSSSPQELALASRPAASISPARTSSTSGARSRGTADGSTSI